MKFCADRGDVNQLEKAFSSIAFTESGESNGNHAERLAPSNGKLQKPQADSATSAAQTELHTLIHSMRKLREAMVASQRYDAFAQRAYVFIIRTAILVRHFQSYHPALLYLLRVIHPRRPLSAPELHEFVGYYILDLCCRQGDLHAAYDVRIRHGYKDRRLDKVLHAIVHDDWVTFWRMRRAVDGHQRALMEHKVNAMRVHVLKCLGKTYMTVEREYLERSAVMEWRSLVKKCGVGWELDPKGELVTIRKPKVKAPT